MFLRVSRSWYRRAAVAASLATIAALVAFVFLVLIPRDKGNADTRLASASGSPAGVSGSLTVEPGASGLRLCNKTTSRVGVAIGYQVEGEWITEGWWNVAANTCETLMAGGLVSRYYYVYAVDYDQGGTWGGKAIMCTRDKMFTIKGIEDCVARGFERTGFFEVDTGQQKSWTVQLTEPTEGTGGR
jgi:uncharacterized membrane protein